MKRKNKTLYFNFRNLLFSTAGSFLLLGALWLLCAGLQKVGCPFPNIKSDKFFDLGFFALSNFSFITFLTMIPFQTTEGQLSPGFFARIVNSAWPHFGLYALLSSFVASFLILSFQNKIAESFYSQLYMAIIGTIIFAIIFHLFLTLRYLYQPLIVYENVAKLADEESSEELWIDLYECTLKAIKANRIGYARNFVNLMSHIYPKIAKVERVDSLQNDILSLREAAKGMPPITTEMEKSWPFLQSKLQKDTHLNETLAAKITGLN